MTPFNLLFLHAVCELLLQLLSCQHPASPRLKLPTKQESMPEHLGSTRSKLDKKRDSPRHVYICIYMFCFVTPHLPRPWAMPSHQPRRSEQPYGLIWLATLSLQLFSLGSLALDVHVIATHALFNFIFLFYIISIGAFLSIIC